jgi:hypothetical protein
MTTGPDGPFEALVGRSLAVDPAPGAFEAADDRVAAAIAQVAANGGGTTATVDGRRPSWPLHMRPAHWAIAGTAAAVVLMGAGGGLRDLYAWLVGSEGGTKVAWDAATPLGQARTVNGYRMTVDRAYADANEVMVAVSVADAGGPPASQIGLTLADLTDDQGTEYDQTMGASAPNGATAAADILSFRAATPIAAGSRTFHLTFATVDVRDVATPPPSDDPTWDPWHPVSGPWTFAFDLPVAGGTTVQPLTTATAAGVTLRLHDVSATAADVHATIEVVSSKSGGTGWAPVGAFLHGGQSIAIGSGVQSATGAMTVDGVTGVTNRSGQWTLRIDELVGNGPSGQVRLQGPWELTFQMP